MEGGWGFVAYVGIKYSAYVCWCYLGIRVFATERSRRSAFAFGAMRLFLGVIFGVGVFFVGAMMHLSVPRHPFVLYLEMYAPVRWLEWSIMAAALAPQVEGSRFLIGASNPSRAWRLGGILVSILADLPIILTSGAKEMLPVGRFLC
jgi:hypothetical protein